MTSLKRLRLNSAGVSMGIANRSRSPSSKPKRAPPSDSMACRSSMLCCVVAEHRGSVLYVDRLLPRRTYHWSRPSLRGVDLQGSVADADRHPARPRHPEALVPRPAAARLGPLEVGARPPSPLGRIARGVERRGSMRPKSLISPHARCRPMSKIRYSEGRIQVKIPPATSPPFLLTLTCINAPTGSVG